MKRFALLVFCVTLGCQSAPPPAPLVLRKPMADFIDKKALAKRFAPKKSFELIHRKPMPLPDEIDALLARRSLLVESSEVNGEYQIALPGVYCNVTRMPRAEALKKMNDPGVLSEPTLSKTDLAAVEMCSLSHAIQCEADFGLPIRQLPMLAEEAVNALAALTDGWIYDPQAGRIWDRSRWTEGRTERPRYNLPRSVSIEARQQAGHYHLRTWGLDAFGIPNLELPVIRAQNVETLRERLYTLADLFIDEFEDGFDGRLTLGAVSILALPKKTIIQHRGPGYNVVWSHDDRATVVLVDPKGSVANEADQEAFTNRLSSPAP